VAHYAFLDENNIVTEIIVGVDENELIEGKKPEEWYSEFRGQRCIRTSYNGSIRKNFACIDAYYDEDFDAFIQPKKYESWRLNYETFQWEPPTQMPNVEIGKYLIWSELNEEWIELEIPNV
jgi:hypothetical protein